MDTDTRYKYYSLSIFFMHSANRIGIWVWTKVGYARIDEHWALKNVYVPFFVWTEIFKEYGIYNLYNHMSIFLCVTFSQRNLHVLRCCAVFIVFFFKLYMYVFCSSAHLLFAIIWWNLLIFNGMHLFSFFAVNVACCHAHRPQRLSGIQYFVVSVFIFIFFFDFYLFTFFCAFATFADIINWFGARHFPCGKLKCVFFFWKLA